MFVVILPLAGLVDESLSYPRQILLYALFVLVDEAIKYIS